MEAKAAALAGPGGRRPEATEDGRPATAGDRGSTTIADRRPAATAGRRPEAAEDRRLETAEDRRPETAADGRSTTVADRRPAATDWPRPGAGARTMARPGEGSRSPRAQALMVAHVVLFRPKPELAAEARQRLVDGFTRAIREIPQIRQARIGRRVTHGRPYEELMHANYSYAAVMEFDNVESLKTYLAHEAHEALGAAFFECFEEALIYDYELGEAVEQLASLLGSSR